MGMVLIDTAWFSSRFHREDPEVPVLPVLRLSTVALVTGHLGLNSALLLPAVYSYLHASVSSSDKWAVRTFGGLHDVKE